MCLREYSTIPLTKNELVVNVASYVNMNSYWNWEALRRMLLDHICSLIAGIQPPSPSLDNDSVDWALNHDSSFSMKTSYSFIAEMD